MTGVGQPARGEPGENERCFVAGKGGGFVGRGFEVIGSMGAGAVPLQPGPRTLLSYTYVSIINGL